MTQFSRDFKDDTIGVLPSDLSEAVTNGQFVVRDIGGSEGKVLAFENASNNEESFFWWSGAGGPGQILNGDVLVKVRFGSLSSQDISPSICRMPTSPTTSTSGQMLAASLPSTTTLRLNQLGPFDSIEVQSISALTTSQNYFIRYNFDGTSHRIRFWAEGSSEPETWNITSFPSTAQNAGFVGGQVFSGTDKYWLWLSVSDDPATPAALHEPSTIPTIRKSSTFDVETTLGTITTATLAGVNVFDHVTGQVGTTVSFAGAATDEITTSGEYSLVLGDGVGTETITVQVNVVGLANFNINKDGADQGSLTDVEFIILTGAAGSRAINEQIINVTTTVGGDTGAIEITDTALNAGDTVMVAQRSDTVTGGGGAFHPATLGLI